MMFCTCVGISVIVCLLGNQLGQSRNLELVVMAPLKEPYVISPGYVYGLYIIDVSHQSIHVDISTTSCYNVIIPAKPTIAAPLHGRDQLPCSYCFPFIAAALATPSAFRDTVVIRPYALDGLIGERSA